MERGYGRTQGVPRRKQPDLNGFFGVYPPDRRDPLVHSAFSPTACWLPAPSTFPIPAYIPVANPPHFRSDQDDFDRATPASPGSIRHGPTETQGGTMSTTTVKHLTTAALEAGLDTIRQAPKDNGVLELIVRRPSDRSGFREVLEEGRLDLAEGLVGDNSHARGSRATSDGAAHPEMQLNVINVRATALVAQERERWPLAGDQLYVDLDLSEQNVPAGTRLAIGDAIIEVTPVPHTGCNKFVARFGRGSDDLRQLAGGQGTPPPRHQRQGRPAGHHPHRRHREEGAGMKVLFIGGTGTISTTVSRLAVDQGIELFHLNRGQSRPGRLACRPSRPTSTTRVNSRPRWPGRRLTWWSTGSRFARKTSPHDVALSRARSSSTSSSAPRRPISRRPPTTSSPSRRRSTTLTGPTHATRSRARNCSSRRTGSRAFPPPSCARPIPMTTTSLCR